MKYIFSPGRLARFSYWLLVMGSAGVLSRCQDAVMAPQQSLQCYVRFDAVRGQVQADATVRQGNEALTGQPVEMPGGLLYQGATMPVVPVEGLTYRRSYAANFLPEHVFSWVDGQGRRQQIGFPMAAISDFHFSEQPLLRSKPATLRWAGGPLEKGEALVLMWENQALQQTMPMEIIRSSGDASIEFPAAKIAELPAGQWILYLVRKRLAKAQLPGMTAQGVLEYYSKSDTLEVK